MTLTSVAQSRECEQAPRPSASTPGRTVRWARCSLPSDHGCRPARSHPTTVTTWPCQRTQSAHHLHTRATTSATSLRCNHGSPSPSKASLQPTLPYACHHRVVHIRKARLFPEHFHKHVARDILLPVVPEPSAPDMPVLGVLPAREDLPDLGIARM